MPTIFGDKVVLGSLTFNDLATKPVEAQYWHIDVLDGWSDTPDLTVYSTELGGTTDGDILGDYFPARARHIIVGGYVLAATRADANYLHDLIAREAVPRNTDLTLTRHESIPKYLSYRRSSKIETQWSMDNGFRWNTTLVAPDPLKYSLNTIVVSAGVVGLSSGGRHYPREYPLTYDTVVGSESSTIYINNLGTAASYPVVQVSGPLTAGAWRLSNEGVGELQIDVSVGIDDVLTADFGTEQIFFNGYPITATLSGDFWKIQPGVNTIRMYAEYNVDAGLTVNAQSAWE